MVREHRLRLRKAVREALSDVVRKGVEKARVITAASVLLLADEGRRGP